MTPEEIERHLDTIRSLAKPGHALSVDAPTASINNPDWWDDGAPRGHRQLLHNRLIEEVRAAHPDVEQDRRAVILAGPPGAGKGGARASALGENDGAYLLIDADEFKKGLLEAAVADGSFEAWLKPPEVRALEDQGQQFFPLEFASLVHEESSFLARTLRADAMREGHNIIIDGVLGGEASAFALSDQLEAAGYTIQVVDVEVPFELSEQRIRSRWEGQYRAALAGEEDSLGGRWVPSEFARDIFDGENGRSKPENNARAVAQRCSAVTEYSVYRTGMDQAHLEQATPVLEVHQQRSAIGAPLRAVARAENPAMLGRPPRGAPRDAALDARTRADPSRSQPWQTNPRAFERRRDTGVER